MKEIDWEERHFQICLALLSCPDGHIASSDKSPSLPKVIEKADQMVGLLKEHYAKKHELQSCNTLSTSVLDTSETKHKETKRTIPKSGIGRSAIRRNRMFAEIWSALNTLGYDRGSDIPYFHLNECCEELNIAVDSVDISKFCKCYDVNIG